MLIPKQMYQRLPVTIVQVKASITSKNPPNYMPFISIKRNYKKKQYNELNADIIQKWIPYLWIQNTVKPLITNHHRIILNLLDKIYLKREYVS